MARGEWGGEISWANSNPESEILMVLERINKLKPITHWSRKFEYPWLLSNGVSDCSKNPWVLDAGGGDGDLQYYLSELGFQVINVDLDETRTASDTDWKILRSKGDLRNLPFKDGVFPSVYCCSVLEHIEKPWEILQELWRVLQKSGRLLLSFDVASYQRWNHTIDMDLAVKLVEPLGFTLPPMENVLKAEFPELEPKVGEPMAVQVLTLCLWIDKT